jgi:hypothetical protein
MNIKDFIAANQPLAKKSQLEPFRAEIQQLKTLYYANNQIRDFLSSNGIEVTQESVRKFCEKNDIRSD